MVASPNNRKKMRLEASASAALPMDVGESTSSSPTWGSPASCGAGAKEATDAESEPSRPPSTYSPSPSHLQVTEFLPSFSFLSALPVAPDAIGPLLPSVM